MKTTRNLLFCLIPLLFTVPAAHAQDFAKYRGFSLGMSLPTVLKYTGQKMADVKVVHTQPAVIQEVTWWPTNGPNTGSQSDTVREIVFSLFPLQRRAL